MSRRRWLALAIAGVAFLLLAGRLIAALWVDRAWYASLGADELWRTMVGHTLAARIGAWVLASAFVYANIYGVRRSVVSVVLPRRVGDLEIGEELPPPVLTGAAFALALLLGGGLALGGPTWLSLATARYGVPFGESDPAFEYDLGFFVYWLPFEQALYTWSLICTAVVIAVVILLYALTPSLRWEGGRLRVTGYVRKHLTILGAVVLALIAWSHRLDAFELLIVGSGAEGAFTYADRHVNVSTDLLLALLTFAAAIAVVATGWVGQVRLAFGIVTVVLVTSLLLRQVLPTIADRMAGTETPVAREGPYRATRAAYTRRAYAVDRIARGSTPSLSSLAELARAVPAWEPEPLRFSLERAGAGALVGDFAWHEQNGELRALAVDAPTATANDDSRKPWRLLDVPIAPSHVGGELSPQPATDDRGDIVLQPVYFQPDAPTPLVIEDAEGVVTGAPFDSFLARLGHAWSQQNFRLLRASGANGEALRMLIRRDVRERVQTLAPAFMLGRAVVPIVVGDTLWWAVDLYTASNHYPLSEHLEVAGVEVSYLRHAAIGLVHAHTGATLIIADPDARLDPMARSWVRRFPKIFLASDRVAAALAARLPAPLDAIHAQAVEFARVGSRSEPVSGRRVPDSGADSLIGIEPHAPIAPVTGDSSLPFHTIPIVDAEDRVRGVIAAPMSARRDPVWIPLEDGDVRWTTASARMRRWSDSASARGDARTVRGAIRVVGVNGRAVLVQPSYRWRSDAAPTLSAVAVFDRGVVFPLEALALGVDSASFTLPSDAAGSFGADVSRLYDRMRDAMRRGDWRAFGAAYDSLGLVVRQRGRAP